MQPVRSATPSAPDCRPGCGACCIAPSIASPIPGMPNGKPAGVRCVQLTEDMRCAVFGRPERPAFCGGLAPSADMCGTSTTEAFAYLHWLERETAPPTAISVIPVPAAAPPPSRP